MCKGLNLGGGGTCPKSLTNPPQYQVFVKLTWHRFLDYSGTAELKSIVKSIRILPKALILFQLNLCHAILYWGSQAERAFLLPSSFSSPSPSPSPSVYPDLPPTFQRPISVLWPLFTSTVMPLVLSLSIPLPQLHPPFHMLVTLKYLLDSCPVGALDSLLITSFWMSLCHLKIDMPQIWTHVLPQPQSSYRPCQFS